MDKVLALAAAIITLPVSLVAAICIRIEDGGPVMFKQTRPGLHEQPFQLLKFRTMIVNADNCIDAKGEPTRRRITRTGRLLRSSSLDELPQLINVLRGDMSVVGPRPILYERAERLNPEQKRRFAIKPGITGLAQISGRNQIRWSERLKLDLEYVDHRGIGLDLKILFKTIKVVLFREGMELDANPGRVDDLPRAGEQGDDL